MPITLKALISPQRFAAAVSQAFILVLQHEITQIGLCSPPLATTMIICGSV